MTPQTLETQTAAPKIERLRFEPVKRKLVVSEKTYITPNMIRIVVKGDELSGFHSPMPDDNIKMLVPDASGKTVMRSYTPRWYDADKGELAIDFAVHEAGPATRWALDVEPGDEAYIAGPRGSKVVTGPVGRWLMLADETAIPALVRRLEVAEAGTPFQCIIAVPGQADEQVVETVAQADIEWIHRDIFDWAPADATPYLNALKQMVIAPDTFIWIAAEGSVVRAIRDYLITERGVDRRWIKATGYWVDGQADTTAKFDE